MSIKKVSDTRSHCCRGENFNFKIGPEWSWRKKTGCHCLRKENQLLLEEEKRNEDEGVVFGDEAGAGLEGDVAEDVEERDLVEF